MNTQESLIAKDANSVDVDGGIPHHYQELHQPTRSAANERLPSKAMINANLIKF